MSQQNRKLVHLFYGIYLSVSIINAALHIIFACYAIYNGADAEFSREIVGAQFRNIAVPVYACLISVIVGFIIRIALPVDKNNKDQIPGIKKRKPAPNYNMTLERLSKKVDVEKCEPELAARIKNERRSRLISICVCAGLCAIASIPLLIYICNFNNYDTYKINESIIPAAVSTLIWCVLAFIYCLAVSFINEQSVRCEIDLLKEAINNKAPAPEVSEASFEDKKKQEMISLGIKGGVLALAIIFIIVGIVNGGMADVLGKAIRLCTECIGLG